MYHLKNKVPIRHIKLNDNLSFSHPLFFNENELFIIQGSVKLDVKDVL